jgi:hypothetical protein
VSRGARRPRLDAFELAVLAGLFALSCAVLAGLLVRVWSKGGVVTGSDGFLVADQLQYLNWLRQAGEHVAVENLYDLDEGPRTFVHPGILVSGLLHQLGLGLAASYLVWKPVAVGALFAGALAWTRRFLPDAGDRRLALVVALFTASPLAAFFGWTEVAGRERKLQFDFLSNEMWPGNWLWGYMFTAIAVAMLPLGLLAYERARLGGGARALALAAAAGLVAAWLQPWQGATFALVLVAAEALALRREAAAGREAAAARAAAAPAPGAGREAAAAREAAAPAPGARLRDAGRRLALPLAATAVPLVYYLVLSLTDPAWELAGEANSTDAIPRWPLWVTILGLAPLAVPAAFAYRLPARDFGEIALRVWPVAALVVFYQPAGTFPFHAFQGLALPLAVLGALALRHRLGGARPLPAAAIAFAVLLVVPGTLYNGHQIRNAVNKGFQPHFLEGGEHDALRHLDGAAEPGGVLAPVYAGLLVPAYTGRETWVGAGSWTSDFEQRRIAAEDLFMGRLRRPQAEALVRRSGARFLLSDCHGRADVARLLARVTEPPARFGCAAVYRVRDRP